MENQVTGRSLLAQIISDLELPPLATDRLTQAFEAQLNAGLGTDRVLAAVVSQIPGVKQKAEEADIELGEFVSDAVAEATETIEAGEGVELPDPDPEEPEEPEEPDTGDTGSLTTLLEELGTLNGNKKAFLEAGKYADDTALGAALTAKEGSVESAMDTASTDTSTDATIQALLASVAKTGEYVGKSDGVKAALEADAQEALTKALAKANENVTAAETAIGKVDGLAAAITAYESAFNADAIATAEAADMTLALKAEVASFAVMNDDDSLVFVGAVDAGGQKDVSGTPTNLAVGDVYVSADGTKLYQSTAAAAAANPDTNTLLAEKNGNTWTLTTDGEAVKDVMNLLAAYDEDVAAQAEATQKAADLTTATVALNTLDSSGLVVDLNAATWITSPDNKSDAQQAEIDAEITAKIAAILAIDNTDTDGALSTLGYTVEQDDGVWVIKDNTGATVADASNVAGGTGSEIYDASTVLGNLNTFQTDVDTAVEAAFGAVPAGDLTQDLLKAKADVETVEGFQTALDEAIAGYETAKADADTLAKFNDDIAQVEANIAEAGYKLQAAGATSNDSDVILFNNLSDNDTITGFGAKFTEGQADYLMIGDYTLVKTEIETVGATTKFGNSADALEVFAVQTSAGVDLYFEKEEAAGNLNYVAGNFTKITLAGLTNDDLNFANGIIEAAL